MKTEDLLSPAFIASASTFITSFNSVVGVPGPPGDKGDKGDKVDKGDKGDTGPQGERGSTPQKGVDYFTPEDIQEVANEALTLIGVAGIQSVDALPENPDPNVLYLIREGDS